MTIAVDLAEFFQRPHRSGIQRVGAELCLGWANAQDVQPVMSAPGGMLLALPADALSLLAKYFRAADADNEKTRQEIRALGRAALEQKRRFAAAPADLVVVPEVFFDPARIDFYRAVLKDSWFRLAFIVFDVLPLTHPSAFPAGSAEAYLRYASVVACCRNLAFISEATGAAFRQRFGGNAQVVLPLGSDALRRERAADKRLPGQPTFVVLGTIEPRKNHLLVLEAFGQVWREFPQTQLVFAGRMGWLSDQDKARIERARAEHPQLTWHEHVDDRLIHGLLERATATIFVSEGEGFGLPPVESLWAGTPCIAGPGIPSLQALGGQGIHTLPALSSEALAEAAKRFLDAAYASAKTQEALNVRLPTWSEFGQHARQWLVSLPPGPSVRAEVLAELQAAPASPRTGWRSRLLSIVPGAVRPVIRSAARRLLRI